MHRISLAIWLALWLPQGALLAAGLPDPTRPAYRQVTQGTTAAVRDDEGWRLTMVRVSARDRIAVLNDRLVAVGDRVGGARVVAIKPSAVDLVKAGTRFTVKLSRPRVKRHSRVLSAER